LYYAPDGVNKCVFLGAEHGQMNDLVGAFVAILALTAQPAAAGSWGDWGGARFDVQAARQRPGGLQRPPPQREFRGSERPPERRPDGRLTDEERRNLHRDLDRANREIYKGR
jgi:hypothetical protein